MENLDHSEQSFFSQIDDAALWLAYKSGNEKAIIFIYQQHYQSLYRYGFKICGDKDLTKDCIHDIFTNLWLKREKNKDVHHIRAYLIKYMRWHLGKKMMQDRRYIDFEKRPTGADEIQFSYESLLVNEQMNQELREKLTLTLQKLSKRQQEAIYLRFYNDLSYEQIAEIMSLRYQSVRNLVHESVKALRDCLTFDFSILLLIISYSF
jgi:RNA polymerase sigma factor (sigma-70 family)